MILKIMLTVLVCATAFAGEIVIADDKSSLRVLYIGDDPENIVFHGLEQGMADNERYVEIRKKRTSAFARLLHRYFDEVKVVFSGDYVESMSAGYDVTIFGNLPPLLRKKELERASDGHVTKIIPAVYLSENYDRATIMIGDVSAIMGESLETKIDWHCLCLYAHAHDMKLDHPIFNQPLPVELTIEDRPTPWSYPQFYKGRNLPESMPMWRVQKESPHDEKGFPPGMVSSGSGFVEAPDAEVISHGENTKERESVALGRHGNFFLWGFISDPDDMTDEARRVFVNTVHYMADYNGHTTPSRRTRLSWPRGKALDAAFAMQQVSYEDWSTMQQKMFDLQKNGVLQRQQGGEQLSFADRRILAKDGPELMDRETWLATEAVDRQPESIVKLLGTDLQKYLPYYLENFEYLRPTEEFAVFEVDEDAKYLGTSNRAPESLQHWINALNTEQDAERARRLLGRYTSEEFTKPSEWQSWYDSNIGRFYFSGVYTYKFEVIPEAEWNLIQNTLAQVKQEPQK